VFWPSLSPVEAELVATAPGGFENTIVGAPVRDAMPTVRENTVRWAAGI